MTSQEAHKISNAKWYAANKLKAKALKAAWYAKNPEYISIANAKFRKLNPQYQKVRSAVDPMYKLRCALRTLLVVSFRHKRWSKTTKTYSMLGCTYDELIQHLSRQFSPGMTLENHGLWHIDHIKPCALATTPEELVQLQHYTNLQPLWAFDNISKGAKYEVQ